MTKTTTGKLPYAGRPEMIQELRDWGNLFSLWRLCARPACRRAQACRGDARHCFPRNFHLLPEGVQGWFNGLGELQKEGVPFDEAVEELDATEFGDAFRDWKAAVSKSLGGDATLPARWWDVR